MNGTVSVDLVGWYGTPSGGVSYHPLAQKLAYSGTLTPTPVDLKILGVAGKTTATSRSPGRLAERSDERAVSVDLVGWYGAAFYHPLAQKLAWSGTLTPTPVDLKILGVAGVPTTGVTAVAVSTGVGFMVTPGFVLVGPGGVNTIAPTVGYQLYEFTQNLVGRSARYRIGSRQDPAPRQRRSCRRFALRRRLVRTVHGGWSELPLGWPGAAVGSSEGSGRDHRRPAEQHARAAEHPPRQPDGELARSAPAPAAALRSRWCRR